MRHASEVVSSRMRAHAKVKDLMHAGLLVEAIQLANSTLIECGCHIGLLCDLAACQYELGQFHSCWLTTLRIQTEFVSARQLLSPGSARRTLVFLAKLNEERGEVAIALENLRHARALAECDDDLRMIVSQELRLRAYLGKHEGLSDLYSLLLERIRDNDSLRIEITHGLMWAEWALFGFDHAARRWIMATAGYLNPLDTRLLSRDFFEISIQANRSHVAEARAAAEILNADLTLSYDRFLLSSISGFDTSSASLTTNEHDFSPMMRIRAILIALRLERSEDTRRELRRRVHFLISSLSKASAALLSELIPPLDTEKRIEIQILGSDQSVKIDGHIVKLTPLQLKFIKAFQDSSEHPLDELALRLWNFGWSVELYDRLRMLVYRTNSALEGKIGGPAFEIRKDGVKILSPIFVAA